MKSKMAIVWFIATVVLACLLAAQLSRSTQQKANLENLQLQVEELTQQSRQAQADVQELRQERSKLRADMLAAETELNSFRQTAASIPSQSMKQRAVAKSPGRQEAAADGQGGGTGNLFGNMLKDPEMRKAMEQQQRVGLDMVYGALFKQLQLTPGQEQKFKEILLNQQMANMSQAGALFGEGDPNQAGGVQKLAEENKKREEQIKELLGDEKFAAYQDYNQTAGERVMLSQFGQQAEITSEQTEQLLAIVRDEKRNFQINQGTEAYDQTKDWQKVMASNEMAEKIFAQQEQVNARVLERAGQVLTPEQLQKFEPILKNQLEMQRAGMKMARQMFGAGQNAAGQNIQPPPPPSQP